MKQRASGLTANWCVNRILMRLTSPVGNLRPMKHALIGASITILWLLSGCKPATSGGDSGTAPITFMVFGDPGELNAYKQLVGAYEAKSGDKVKLIHVPSQADYRKRLGTDFAAGTPTDVVLINYRRFLAFAKKGVTEILDPYLNESKTLKRGDYYPQAIEAFTWDGSLHGIPQNVSSLVVFYNKKIFDDAKVPYPREGWTLDDFVATAKSLTRDTDGDGKVDIHGLGTEVSLQRLAPFVWMFGGLVTDNAFVPTQLRMHDPESKAAFQWFVDLRLKHKVSPDLAEEKSEDSETRFQNGRLAMFLDSRRFVPAMREQKTFDWDVAPLPQGKVKAGILHSDAYFMAKAAKDKPRVWRFIEFANSAEGQSIIAKSGRTVPSLKSVSNSPAFLDPNQKPANSRVFLDTLSMLKALPHHVNWNDIEVHSTNDIESAYYGKVTVDQAVDAMIKRTAVYFAGE